MLIILKSEPYACHTLQVNLYFFTEIILIYGLILYRFSTLNCVQWLNSQDIKIYNSDVYIRHIDI